MSELRPARADVLLLLCYGRPRERTIAGTAGEYDPQTETDEGGEESPWLRFLSLRKTVNRSAMKRKGPRANSVQRSEVSWYKKKDREKMQSVAERPRAQEQEVRWFAGWEKESQIDKE